jgi:hypothetical protein
MLKTPAKPIEWLKVRAADPNIQRRRALFMERAKTPNHKMKVTANGWALMPKQSKIRLIDAEPVEEGYWTSVEMMHMESSCHSI